MGHILVVEDDLPIADEIATELRQNGHSVEQVSNGADAVERAMVSTYDLITLDRMLPGLDGLSLVSALREKSIETPVLMISALSDVDDRIEGLRAGGDDYMIKPFSSAEMAMRVEALLRRRRPPLETILTAGGVEIDLLSRQARLLGQPLRLLPMELKLLELFLANPGRVLSRKIIFEKVWNYHFDPGANLVNVHVGRLRRKLEEVGGGVSITTVVGEGYRFDPDG